MCAEIFFARDVEADEKYNHFSFILSFLHSVNQSRIQGKLRN